MVRTAILLTPNFPLASSRDYCPGDSLGAETAPPSLPPNAHISAAVAAPNKGAHGGPALCQASREALPVRAPAWWRNRSPERLVLLALLQVCPSASLPTHLFPGVPCEMWSIHPPLFCSFLSVAFVWHLSPPALRCICFYSWIWRAFADCYWIKVPTQDAARDKKMDKTWSSLSYIISPIQQ